MTLPTVLPTKPNELASQRRLVSDDAHTQSQRQAGGKALTLCPLVLYLLLLEGLTNNLC